MIERVETERLVLRPITTGDAGLLVALDSDPAVMRFINGGKPTPLDDADGIVRRSLGHRWIACDRTTGEFVGWFGLRLSDDEGRQRELGYRLLQARWNRGLATEASHALLATAFTQLATERVWAQTMAVNTASRRVMEHCGMHYVRTFHLDWPERIEGTELGDVEYELTKAEWSHARR